MKYEIQMAAVVEFHGFKDNTNRFIIKEFAIVGKHFQSQVIFKPPYSFKNLNEKMQRTAKWLSRHFHNIKWDEDGIPYDEQVIRDLCNPFTILYTKGLEKVNFLQEFHYDVREITWSRSEIDDVHCLLLKHNNNVDTKCALKSAKSFIKNL